MVTTNTQSHLVSLAQPSTGSIIHPFTEPIHLSLELYKHSYESAFIFSCLNINRIMLSAQWPSLKMKFFVAAENKAENLQPALHYTTASTALHYSCKENNLWYNQIHQGQAIRGQISYFHLCNSWVSQRTKQHFKVLYCATDRNVQAVKYVYTIHICN